MSLRLFTSESVTEGHPDKLADQISDAILDDLLRQDPTSRVAVETMLTTGLVHVGGEIRTKGYADIPTLVRDLVRSVGYTSSEASFDADTCGITSSIGNQSPEIAAGVDHAQEARDGDGDLDSQLGAGDQGIMFGFASNETPTYMPATAYAAHLLAQRLAEVRHSGELDYLLPDGKTQVTIGYDGYTPVTVETVVISTQHRASVTLEQLQADVRRVVIDPVIGTLGLDSSNMTVIINPAGPFTIGGPLGDAGLTGRKIIVDTYGGAARHGGGAFSGKDPSKVDRSAA
ncbi:MAG: methionine adenosyltransferase, partial [Agrococcus casei]